MVEQFGPNSAGGATSGRRVLATSGLAPAADHRKKMSNNVDVLAIADGKFPAF
nr:hypothetical protein [Mycobacterium pseudoshottsii]